MVSLRVKLSVFTEGKIQPSVEQISSIPGSGRERAALWVGWLTADGLTDVEEAGTFTRSTHRSRSRCHRTYSDCSVWGCTPKCRQIRYSGTKWIRGWPIVLLPIFSLTAQLPSCSWMSVAFRSDDSSELHLERRKDCSVVSAEKLLPFHTVKRIPWRHCLSKAIQGLTCDKAPNTGCSIYYLVLIILPSNFFSFKIRICDLAEK